METVDIERRQDNTKLLKEYADRIMALGNKENNTDKNSNEEE